MKCLKFLILAVMALASPVMAQQRPLIIMNGQTRQLPPATTLTIQPSTSDAASINVPAGTPPASPVNGDCWNTSAGWTCRASGVSVVQPVIATTRSALAAMPSTLQRALRTGSFVAGDTSTAIYTASASACSLNSGAGDGGSQVPTSDGKCWLANFPEGIYAKQFGAVCGNSAASAAADTAAIKAAVAYAATVAPARVILPQGGLCAINSTITLPTGVSIEGVGTDYSGLLAAVPNLNPMVSITGDNVGLRNMYIYGGAGGANTSGWMVSTSTAGLNYIKLNEIRFNDVCGAIDFSGSYSRFDNIFIGQAGGASCTTVRLGHLTTTANTVDLHINQMTVAANLANRAALCMLIEDTGGLLMSHSDFQTCQKAMIVKPGANQKNDWTTIDSTYLADTNTSDGLTIDTAAASATVEGFSCNDCWASSVGGDGIKIANTGGGIVRGLYFNGLRAYGNLGNAISILTSSVSEAHFTNAHICSYGATQAGISLASGVSKVSVTNSEIKPDCAVRAASGQYGMYLGGSNADITISNIDMRGNTTQVAGVPIGNSFVSNVNDNTFGSVSVASAATLNFTQVNKHWQVTGTTTVSTINGGWADREVKIFPTAATPFVTGGNICNSYTAAPNVMITATYFASCWYLK